MFNKKMYLFLCIMGLYVTANGSDKVHQTPYKTPNIDPSMIDYSLNYSEDAVNAIKEKLKLGSWISPKERSILDAYEKQEREDKQKEQQESLALAKKLEEEEEKARLEEQNSFQFHRKNKKRKQDDLENQVVLRVQQYAQQKGLINDKKFQKFSLEQLETEIYKNEILNDPHFLNHILRLIDDSKFDILNAKFKDNSDEFNTRNILHQICLWNSAKKPQYCTDKLIQILNACSTIINEVDTQDRTPLGFACIYPTTPSGYTEALIKHAAKINPRSLNDLAIFHQPTLNSLPKQQLQILYNQVISLILSDNISSNDIIKLIIAYEDTVSSIKEENNDDEEAEWGFGNE